MKNHRISPYIRKQRTCTTHRETIPHVFHLVSDQPRDLITNLCIHPSPPTRCRHSSSPCQSVTKSRQPAVQIPSSLSKGSVKRRRRAFATLITQMILVI
uniref:Uncharacterized protein n=1 Tax=Glycine max TaxID=3847 RepID=A0A0R0L9U1_SOYBN